MGIEFSRAREISVEGAEAWIRRRVAGA